MPDYNKPRFQPKQFGQRPFAKKGAFDRGPRQMFKAECAKCGDVCEVPFRPNGIRPVYCSNCFVKDAPQESRFERREAPSHAPRPDQAFNDLKAELRVVNQNLERLIALMTPTTAATAAPTATKASKKKGK